MTTPRFTLKLRSSRTLLDRIEAAADALGIMPADFVRHAIEKELRYQEVSRIKEDVALVELQKNVVGRGMGLAVLLEEEGSELATCQLCLKTFPRRPESVEGPLFCPECMELAKGGDFSVVLEPEP